ncbi:hypothetical protein D9M68_607070 [compost metagenome]
MLEGARQAEPRDPARARPGHGLAQQRDLARGRRVHTGNLVEHCALACAVGADEGENLARPDFQVHSVVGDQAAELAGHVHGLEHHFATRRHGLAGQGLGIHVQLAHLLLQRNAAGQHRPQAAAGAMQQQHHAEAEDDNLEVARLAQQPRHPVLQPLLEHREYARAHQRAPDLPRAADDGHEQVFDAHLQAERVGIHEALHVRVKPAGGAGLQRGDDEDHHARTGRVHAHRLRHHAAALERADGAALARVQQVLRRPHRRQQEGPDQVVDAVALGQRPAEQVDGGNVWNAGVAAQAFDGTEDEVERQAPGDGAQRQEVAGQFQRDRAQQVGDRQCQRQPGQQRQPGRGAQPRQP